MTTSRTVSEAIEEYAGLRNEAEAFLDTAAGEGAALVFQLLELAGEALLGCHNFENRMSDAVAVLYGIVKAEEPTVDQPPTETLRGAQEATQGL